VGSALASTALRPTATHPRLKRSRRAAASFGSRSPAIRSGTVVHVLAASGELGSTEPIASVATLPSSGDAARAEQSKVCLQRVPRGAMSPCGLGRWLGVRRTPTRIASIPGWVVPRAGVARTAIVRRAPSGGCIAGSSGTRGSRAPER
jgi:hypothetical protein